MCAPQVSPYVTMQATGQLIGGVGEALAGNAADKVLGAQAVAVRDAATAEAEMIRRGTGRAVGASRAQMAANGVSLDSATAFDITEDIFRRGEQDALMTILSGERRARELQYEGKMKKAAGRMKFAESVLEAGSTVGRGWYAPAQNKAYAGGQTGFYGGYGRSGD